MKDTTKNWWNGKWDYIKEKLRTVELIFWIELTGLLVSWMIYLVKKFSPTLQKSSFEVVNIIINEIEIWIIMIFAIGGVITLVVSVIVDTIKAIIGAKQEIEKTNDIYGGNPDALPTKYAKETKKIIDSVDSVTGIKKKGTRKGGANNEDRD